jgi:hypothetical protein
LVVDKVETAPARQFGNSGTNHLQAQLVCKIGRRLLQDRETPKVRHVKPQPVRNKIDLADASQVRGLKKQLHISADDLQRAVGTVGNSIAAVSKELLKTNPVTGAQQGPINPP